MTDQDKKQEAYQRVLAYANELIDRDQRVAMRKWENEFIELMSRKPQPTYNPSKERL